MGNLLKTWEALSVTRRVMLVLAVLGSLAAVLMIGRIAATPSMALLYGGLDQKNAGEVVAALEAMNVTTDVRGDAIYVPAAERDRVRLALAQQGLPGQGQAGYELLDNISGFGTTSEMFRAAYWRAKEGELARTIHALPNVRKARVHIGAGGRRPFSRGTDKATAAVTLRTTGEGLSERKALAIRYLVALAVANLDPEDVAVIDAERGVVLAPGAERPSIIGAQHADRKAQALRLELEELLGVRVGPGNVRVSVTVETTKKSETVSERLVDPDSQVPMKSNTTEIADTSTGSDQGVTVASNLPEGDAANARGRENKRTETRETVDYRYSETRRDQRIEAGAVKRLGVAVIVNEVSTVGEDGTRSYAPRPPEELAAIEELVKSAIAYDSERGDTVTVESLRFAELPEDGVVVEENWFDRLVREQGPTILQIIALGLVALLIGLFVLRPILAQQAADESSAADAIAELEAAKSPQVAGEQAAAIASQLEDEATKALAPADAVKEGALAPVGREMSDYHDPEAARMAALQAGDAYAAISGSADAEHTLTLGERLEEAVSSRTPEVGALLRHWLSNPDAEDDTPGLAG